MAVDDDDAPSGAVSATHARHIEILCRYYAREGPAFERRACEERADEDGFEFLPSVTESDDGTKLRFVDGTTGALAEGVRAAREMYAVERRRALEAHAAFTGTAFVDDLVTDAVADCEGGDANREADASAHARSEDGGGDARGSVSVTADEMAAAVSRAQEIAQRLFANASETPPSQPPREDAERAATPKAGETRDAGARETIVVDFGADGAVTMSRRGEENATPGAGTQDQGDDDDDDDFDFDTLLSGFVREEIEEDVNAGDDAIADAGTTVNDVAVEPPAVTEAVVEQPPVTTEAEEVAVAENPAPKPAETPVDKAEETVDLSLLFPSSKRKPVGDLGGFEEIMKPKKKKKPKKPKYAPTPKLTDDLVGLPVPSEDQDDDDELAETDVDDSPQVTEAVEEVFFLPGRPVKMRVPVEEDEDVTQRVAEETHEETEVEVLATTDVEDEGEDDAETAFEAVEEIVEATEVLATTDVEDEGEEEVFQLPGRPVAKAPEEPVAPVEEEHVAFMLPGRPVRKQKEEETKEPVPKQEKRKVGRPPKKKTPPPAAAAPALMAFALPGRPVNAAPMFPGKPIEKNARPKKQTKGKDAPIAKPPPVEDKEREASEERTSTPVPAAEPEVKPVASTSPKLVDSPADCANDSLPTSKTKAQKKLPPKIVADTVLAQRVMTFIKSTLQTQELTRPQYKMILRKSMHKVITTVPEKFNQNTEEGASLFLTDSRKRKINTLLDAYIVRVRARAGGPKGSTPNV
jgi:hypothetical protein